MTPAPIPLGTVAVATRVETMATSLQMAANLCRHDPDLDNLHAMMVAMRDTWEGLRAALTEIGKP
jgi:hypothetical protein